MSNYGLHVVFLPKWYPDKFDPQNGVFIQKHAWAVSLYAHVTILYATTDDSINKPQFEEKQISDKLTEIRLYYPPRKLPLIGKALTAMRYTELMLAKLKAFNLKKKIDVIHAHVLLRPALIARWYALNNNIPYLISEHWSGYGRGLFDKRSILAKFLSRKVMAEASVVSTISPFLKDTMIACGLKANYFTIPNVVDIDTNSIKKKNPDKTIYLTIGDLNDSIKNISGIIKVFSRVIEINNDVELHIIGGGYDEPDLMELANDIGILGKQVIFHSRQNHDYVMAFLPKADVYINNSRFETFSVTVAEAAANKIPVITTKCGGPQSFFDKRMGIEIPVDDDEALLVAMKTMLATHKQYQLDETAAHIKNMFSAETVGRQFYELYKSVI